MENMNIGKEQLEIINLDNNIEGTIDFNNPYIIISYGTALLDEMGNIMKNIASMKETSKIDSIDLEEKLKKINSFSNYLEKEDSTLVNKKGLISKATEAVVSIKKEFVSKVLGKGVYTESYADEYLKINEEIDAIGQIVEQRKQSTLENMQIDSAFVSKMKVYIERLNNLIETGYQAIEKENYLIEQMDEEQNIDNDEIKQRKILVKLFEQRLQDLKQKLALAKNYVLETKQKEQVNMNLFLSYQSYIEGDIQTLRLQSSSMITTRMQRNNLVEQEKLNQITNDVIRKNSEVILGNIEKVNTLRSEGNIKMETINELRNNVKKGIELLQRGNQQVMQNIQENDAMLNDMIQSFDNYSKEIDSLTLNAVIKQDNGFQKQIGFDKK